MKSVEGKIENVRILITDDNAAIHEDFRRILATAVQDDANLSCVLARRVQRRR